MQGISNKTVKMVSVYIILLVFLLACLFAGFNKRDIVITTGFSQTELMRINGKKCFLPEMMLYLTTMQNQYEAVYGEEIWNQQKDGVTLDKKVKDMVLAKIAQVKVMNLMAESYGLTLTEEEADHVRISSERFFRSLNDTEKELIGINEETIHTIYTEYAMANKVYDYVIRDVNPEISDDEARTITFQEIFIKTYSVDADGNRMDLSGRTRQEAKEKAVLVKELLDSGEESFEALSAKYSDAEELSVTCMRGELSKSLEDAAFSLSFEEVSDVIETEDGYYILKCISTFDVAGTQLNKVEILDKRKEAVFDRTYDEFLKSLQKTLNEKLYDSIEMIHNPEVRTSDFFDVEF